MAGEQQGVEQLLSVLRERDHEGLKGFHTKNANSLATYLADEGYTDERPILDAPEVELRIRAAPAAREVLEQVTPRLVHTWCRFSPTPPADNRGIS